MPTTQSKPVYATRLKEQLREFAKPQQNRLVTFFEEVLTTRYLDPIRPPNPSWRVIYPKDSGFSLLSSLGEALAELKRDPEGNGIGSSAEFGLHPRTAQLLDASNRVIRAAEANQRTGALDKMGDLFQELSEECAYDLPGPIASDIAFQNRIISGAIVVEDRVPLSSSVPFERINRMREVLRDGYGFAGQQGTSTLVFTGILNDTELFKHIQRHQAAV